MKRAVTALFVVLLTASCAPTPTQRAMSCTPSGQTIGSDACVGCAQAWDAMSEEQKATFASPSVFFEACSNAGYVVGCADGYIDASASGAACDTRGGRTQTYHFLDG